ncbi:hypothetical protein GOP47_0016955 [Adiantum capillus-veneris]|uniref:Uncharacterized protein n=1 Tax=Adiantum capillus-veneris TaxID=13818 RepID=A0A9D4UIS5_ADICA|nr:hypothetical protein GOP47_0016955 [Adiantum capillus-veneris]
MGMDKETAITPRASHTRTARAAPESDEAQEIAAKYRRYEKEYLRRINHKYFSGLMLSGDSVFETSVTVDGFAFKESKTAPLKKFVEGPSVSEDNGRADTVPAPSRKNSTKKN